ncbi:GNAT family N-acetyltransferase [Pedobacter sp. SYSU D00535]|uniref:GNAT family N-acetyltransferase n=1 Tax=Pedobacter sp. SYSU D00535 TaxID=2810308 RepID=UPI001A958F8D|nr:GNAT family protein [Pedobacter sp. SYSU D00535]
MNAIYLRPLSVEDAKTSYRWRNNPEVWSYTKFKAEEQISVEVETEWLQNVLKRKNEKRFAICLKNTNQYVGNIQLLNIADRSAEFHIFIGEPSLWGKGIGKAATSLLMNYAFNKIKLSRISLEVKPDNLPGVAVYTRMGFEPTGEHDGFIVMELTRVRFRDAYKRYKLVEQY